MSQRSETFGRLLKGAINSIAAYEGKTAPAVEDELGARIGVAGSAIQRYKSGYLPPDMRAVQMFAEAAVRAAGELFDFSRTRAGHRHGVTRTHVCHGRCTCFPNHRGVTATNPLVLASRQPP